MIDINSIAGNVNLVPDSKVDLFLCLAALNLQNKLVKDPSNSRALQHWEIKRNVSMLASTLLRGENVLYEQLEYDLSKKCIYIRCFGLQFAFHHVPMEVFTPRETELISSNEVAWNKKRLKDYAEELYLAALDAKNKNLAEDDVAAMILKTFVDNG